MPAEIADSDAESDFNSPSRPALGQEVEPSSKHDLPPTASLDINFDDFIDPTQRLSSLPSTQPGSATRATGSTTRLLNGISEAHDAVNTSPTHGQQPRFPTSSPNAKSSKRSRSAFHESSHGAEFDDSARSSKVKRIKTYGQRSKSGTGDHANLFATSSELLPTAGNSGSTESGNRANNIHASNTLDQAVGLNPSTRSDTEYSAPVRLLDQSMQGSLQHMSTSMASMGGYASIDLNYRDSGQGLDVNANPFGSLSQVSLDEDPNPLETERFASVFLQNGTLPVLDHINEGVLITNGNMQAFSVSLPSEPMLGQQLSVDPSALAYNNGAVLHPSVGDQDTVNETGPARDTTPARKGKTQSKKRGRKPKNAMIPSKSPALGASDEEMDEHGLLDLELPRRSRQGTVDSVSAASHASSTTKRRRRGKSKQATNIDEQDAPNTEISPVKQPTSELNLSDEQIIGLPKEAYKPRPSRSRSKKLVDESEIMLPPPPIDAELQTPAKGKPSANDTVPPTHGAEPTPAKSSSKNAVRKSKVKRAKTSAAALLKKADPMLSEGEEDVVWMDSKPAPVKLDLPLDLKVLKKEQENKITVDGEKSNAVTTKQKNSKITIEIPPVAEDNSTISPDDPPPATVAPKKRGRKPKKVEQELGQEKTTKATHMEPDDEEENEANKNSNRSALSEVSNNIPPPYSKKARNTTPKAPTVSPLSSPKVEQESQITNSPSKTPVPITLTTPVKPSEKGPTKHSPINPPSLASSGKKFLYRIGLSRRQNIPSLLRRVQRDKPPPKIVVVKEKEKKKKNAGDNGSDDEVDANRAEMRGADGMLIEWGD